MAHMADQQHQTIYLRDYTEPNYWAAETRLHFRLEEDRTLVTSVVRYTRNSTKPNFLRLHGRDLKLVGLKIDGKSLPLAELDYSPQHLTLKNLPDQLEVAVTTELKPHENTALEGLYKSSGKFCTQCEPEGFRRITYYLDRPDVMSEFYTTIEADRDRYPVLLSNGNLIRQGELDNNRHFCTWHDPFPKPSYLFALVAGDLVPIEDSFTTKSGRNVALKIFVEDFNRDKCGFAMESVKQAMKWDEDVYGLEYDLDIFMIVAVSDFNMGAMENKGLNIFNSKYILAKPETATDHDFEAIQGVVGHEYFHNWTGNRITCRDWFQLSLKEGLTVFRDQEFSADMTSRAVKRIAEVSSLRNSQFLEDSGPMAHPVRPDRYMEINNFYTATVYNKGAEVIRMIHTMIGEEAFQRGMDLYTERHDGQAATIEDFVRAMADASGTDLTRFMRWYTQAGTPKLNVTMTYEPQAERLRLTFEQVLPDTPDHRVKEPFTIPVKTAFLLTNGEPESFNYQGKSATEHVLIVSEKQQEFVFDGIKEKPIPSFLRDFSAPVFLNYEYHKADLRFLLKHETNDFNRFEAAQNLAITIIKDRVFEGTSVKSPDRDDLASFCSLLTNDRVDPRLMAKALTLPSVEFLTNSFPGTEVEKLFDARQWLAQAIAQYCEDDFLQLYQSVQGQKEFSLSQKAVENREVKRISLQYLTQLEKPEYFAMAFDQFQQSNNMTDKFNALACLVHHPITERDQALKNFYDTWHQDELVLDKWFALQASSNHPEVLSHVQQLVEHKDFNLLKPNRVYAVLRQFIRCNPYGFHHPSGDGYRLMADYVLKLDPKNSQVASMLATALSQWKSFDPNRQMLMKDQLMRIKAQKDLSKDTYEVIAKSLAEA